MLLIALGGEGLPNINPTILIRHTQLIRVWLLLALRVILGRFILNPPKTSLSALALANQPSGRQKRGSEMSVPLGCVSVSLLLKSDRSWAGTIFYAKETIIHPTRASYRFGQQDRQTESELERAGLKQAGEKIRLLLILQILG